MNQKKSQKHGSIPVKDSEGSQGWVMQALEGEQRFLAARGMLAA